MVLILQGKVTTKAPSLNSAEVVVICQGQVKKRASSYTFDILHLTVSINNQPFQSATITSSAFLAHRVF